ncbi:nuclear transport factor 2 family protein [Burkholderiaceae bacterium UC74_6]
MQFVHQAALFTAALLAGTLAHASSGLPADAPLYRTQAQLDAELFGAYNRCELDKFQALLADDVEFFHDQGGLMSGAGAVTAAVKANICGKVRRELVAGSLEVHEMKNYGALVMGSHRFCPAEGTGRCEGIARFAHLWKLQPNGRWQVTKVLSFDHRPNNP